MKQLIEGMIGDYLNESYEDDLVESIFEEVSEETWEAIEEAILNELSPKLLKRYKKKAQQSLDRNTEKSVKNREKEAEYTKHSEKWYDKSTKARYRTPREAGKRAYAWDTQSGARKMADKTGVTAHTAKVRADAADNVVSKRQRGLTSINKREKSDFNNLSAEDFKKKYRMTKSEWQNKNS
jgi:hypothetical protein